MLLKQALNSDDLHTTLLWSPTIKLFRVFKINTQPETIAKKKARGKDTFLFRPQTRESKAVILSAESINMQ